MARAPSEEPQGLVYRPELISDDEERGLLAQLEGLRFDPIVLHGRTARRTARHYGLDYDYEARTPQPGEPIPEWVEPARERAAELAGLEPRELVEVLVQRYPAGSTIGWHRDAPAFGASVVGVSLLSACRMRFRRRRDAGWETYAVELEPRSAYVLGGAARASWQHSIPPAKELRYSITFRTLRRPRAASPE